MQEQDRTREQPIDELSEIRDDKGYWRQVEEYIRDHSEAEFSHGICPDCMRSLYPEIADDILGRLNKNEKQKRFLHKSFAIAELINQTRYVLDSH